MFLKRIHFTDLYILINLFYNRKHQNLSKTAVILWLGTEVSYTCRYIEDEWDLTPLLQFKE